MIHSNERIIKHKVGLLDLAEELGNVSKACQMMGLSRDTFYRYKAAVEEGGVEGLLEKDRRRANVKNRTDERTEGAVVEYAIEQPAHGQIRTSNELRKRGFFLSPSGVRSVWLRHDAIEAGGPGRKTQRRIIAHEQTLGALKLDLAAIARPPRRAPNELALRLEARAAALAITVEHGRGEQRRNALLELHELMSRIEVSPGSELRETIVRLTPRHDALLALGLAREPVSKKYLDAARAARAAAAESASPDTPAPQTEPGSAS